MTKRRSSERITQQQNRPCVNRYSDGCEFDRCTWWQHDDDDDNNINNNRNKMRHTTTTTTWRVFYGCILNAIGTWLRNWGDQGLPWHDIAVERRHPKSATSSTWHQIDYSSANMTINSRWAPQSSSMHICQTQMRHDYGTRSIIWLLQPIWRSRVDFMASHIMTSSEAQIDYNNATMTIHCCGALQTSSTHVYQTQMHHIWRIWGNNGVTIHDMAVER